MIETESTSIAQLAVALVVALAGLSYGIQKLVRNWKATDAESSIITIMHRELERMAAQNTILAKELNKLQLEIINLNKELHNLSIENQRLNTEITSLTLEVSRLQVMLGQNRGTEHVSKT